MQKVQHDDVVVITGSAKRVGKALALHLFKQGYRVVIHCNTATKEAEEVRQLMGERGCVVAGDLKDLSAIPALFTSFVSCFGKVDALINNASFFHHIPMEDTTVEQWQADMALHAGAPFFLAQQLQNHLKARSATGALINITDTQLASPPASRPSYYLSKAALQDQTTILARQLAPYVRVNAVKPGLVLPQGDDSFFTKMEAILPLKRCGSPQDICEAVSYLLGAHFVTGVSISVDGGHHLL